MTGNEPPPSAERATALEKAGDGGAAALEWQRLADARPGDPGPMYRLGVLFHDSDNYLRAFVCFREALNRGDKGEVLALRIGHCLVSTGRAEDALPYYLRLLDEGATPQRVSAYLFALLLAPNVPPEETAREHVRLAGKIGKGAEPGAQTLAPPGETLRIGFVSDDLGRLHPVAQLLEPALARLAGNGAEICVYVLGPLDETWRNRVESYARLRSLHGVADTDAARLIAKDRLDLLVDLSGHTSGNRLPVLSLRPAPRQATFLGYPFSSGAPFIDALIADPIVCPPEEEALYRERIVRLPVSFACFDPTLDMPEDRGKSARDAPVFGSLNNAAKLNRPSLAVWARVLEAAPGARLLLKTKAFSEDESCERIKRQFAELGADPERISFEPRSLFAEAMARYRDIDIALDPLGYNGGITTAQALWMGTPVVTAPGRLFCARMGASLLNAAERPQWIAGSLDEYVRIAAGLAADMAALKAEQNRLLEALPASPLCDLDAYAEGLLAAFRDAAEG